MIEANKMVKGKTRGMSFGVKYSRNFPTTMRSRSLPASSLMYNHMVCSTKMNMRMVKTLKKVLR
jgi:hypothetical protein